MKNILLGTFLLIITLLVFYSCTKEIQLDFPEADSQLVVDGIIEPGSPPFVFLNQSNSFNVGLDPASLAAQFIHGADISIQSEGVNYPLEELCVSDLDENQLILLSESIGIPVEVLSSIEYCIYTNFSLIGEVGKTYDLTVIHDGATLTSSTSILNPIPLDTLWFETNASDSLGLIHGALSDPPNEHNAYRWFAQRISHRPGTGEMEDPTFIAPLGSAFDDAFFDGLSFEFFAARGMQFNSTNAEDNNVEAGLFKVGDTVVVKFCTITPESYLFYFTMEDQIINNGSPFATPGNIPSNIDGGLGVWTGYSHYLDTLVLE